MRVTTYNPLRVCSPFILNIFIIVLFFQACQSDKKESEKGDSATTTTNESHYYPSKDKREMNSVVAMSQYNNVLIIGEEVYYGEIPDETISFRISPLEKEWEKIYQLCMKNSFEQDFVFAGLGSKYAVGTILNQDNLPLADLRDYVSPEEFAFLVDSSSSVGCDIGYTVSKDASIFAKLNFKCSSGASFKLEKEMYDSAIVNTGGYVKTELLLNRFRVLDISTQKKLAPYYKFVQGNPRLNIITRTIGILGFDTELYLNRKSTAALGIEVKCLNLSSSDTLQSKKERRIKASCDQNFTAFVQLNRLKRVQIVP